MFCMSAVGRLVSCAVTQEITGWNGLLTMRIPHLHSALLKDRKTPPSCVEIEQPVVPPMNSLHLMDFLSWRKEVTISHCKKKTTRKKQQQHITLLAQVITLPNTVTFRVSVPLSGICLTTSCHEEQRDRNTVKWAHFSCNWSLTYRWAELLRSLWGLTLFPFGSWPQIIQGWAGLHASSVLWGQVRL